MIRASFPRLAIVGLAVLAAQLAPAQTPELVLAAKFPGYRQISATETQPDESLIGVQVAFPSGTPTPVNVQLRTPLGATFTLARDPADGSFVLERHFATRGEMNAAFPDGPYTVVATGQSPSSTAFTLTTTPDIPPALLRNFDALQATPENFANLEWSPIAGSAADDYISVTVSHEDGTEVYSTADSFPGNATLVVATNLPVGVPLRGEIDYARVTLDRAGNGATIAVARGFALRFALRVVPPPPTITREPAPQVVEVGGSVFLSVGATGPSLAYRWRKDGVAIPGATNAALTLPNASPATAGRYSVEISNPVGAVTSRPAPVIVSPVLRVTTFAGSPDRASGFADGPGASARFFSPQGLGFDGAGNLYVADADNATIRKITPAGAVSTVAGTAGQFGTVDATGAAARFRRPTHLAVDRTGNVYVTDITSHTIRKVTPDGVVTTLAGSADKPGYLDGIGATARFRDPHGIAVNAAGEVFVGDSGNNVIRRITPGGVVSTFAGTAEQSFADGVGASARFAGPHGLAFDLQGNLLVADALNSALRRITPAGVVSTLAGGTVGLREDGAFASGAQFYRLEHVAVDRDGTIYLLDSILGIYRLTADGLVVHVAGNRASPGLADGLGSSALFYFPVGIAIDASGTLFLGDNQNHAIRRATFVAGSTDPLVAVEAEPQPQTIAPGDSVAFSVAATGPGLAYQWLRNGEPIRDANGPTLLLRNQSEAASYAVMIGNAAGAVATRAAPLSLTSTNDPGRIVNLSIRSLAGRDAQTLTVGFALGGGPPGAASPALIVRGIGPGLAPFGVPNVLSDPAIALIRNGQNAGGNNDWSGLSSLSTAFASVGAFPLDNASRDAALIATLAPGPYSVQVTSADSRTGIALAEIYDAGPRAAGGMRLVNVSARTQVGIGADILVAGFVIGGSTSKTLLVRGIGPALSAFGLSNYLADPQLELSSSAGARIAANDNWGGTATLVAAAQAVGAFTLFDAPSRDAAFVVTLPPGNYTAQVSASAGNATGIGLVEIYEVP